jgi:hypothetical protein
LAHAFPVDAGGMKNMTKRLPLGNDAVSDAKADVLWEADVVIAGGAVAGASMAHALAEYSISSVLLERQTRVPEINRGDVLQPLSLSFLDRWGSTNM